MEELSKTTRWSKTTVPDTGTSLLTEFAAGRLLRITSAYGSISDSGENLAELPDGRAHPLTIESVVRTDETVTVCVQVTSIGNPEPYKLERIGIFAAAGGADGPEDFMGEEKMLMVIEDTEDERGGKGVTVPAETDQLYSFKLYAVLTVTNKERLEVSVSTAGIATIGAIEDAMKAHQADPNAHPGLMGKSVDAHNVAPEAHPALAARTRGLEVALNGNVTLTGYGDPTSETVGKKGQHYINLQTGKEFVCTDDEDGTYTWEPDSSDKSLREILEETKATAKAAKDVADGAAKAIAAVQNTISVIPSQFGTLTYNKGAQKPTWNNYATEMMDVTYGEERTKEAEFQGETAAGKYKAYFKPKEGYTWGDKSSDEKEVEWAIQRATVASVPSVSGTLTYTGSPQAPTWKNFNEEQLTKEETEQTNAGEHSTVFTPKDNYQWSGGDIGAKTVKWTIEKAKATFSISPKDAQSINVGGTVAIQVTSNSDADISAESDNASYASTSVDTGQKKVTITGTGQGTANITISSKGSQNYADASAVISVAVTRKTPSFSINPSGSQSLSIGGSLQVSVTTDSDGTVSASSNTPGVATASASGKTVTISGASAGGAQITISVPQTTKYNAASATLSVTVSKPTVANSSWDDIAAISAAGTAASYFAPGDTKDIVINGKVGNTTFTNLAIKVFVIGINHNASKEGANLIHWLIGKINGNMVGLCDSKYGMNTTDSGYFTMNTTNTNVGGWEASYRRKTLYGNDGTHTPTNPLANSLMATLPADLRKVMKAATKYSDNKGNHSSSSQGVASDVTRPHKFFCI